METLIWAGAGPEHTSWIDHSRSGIPHRGAGEEGSFGGDLLAQCHGTGGTHTASGDMAVVFDVDTSCHFQLRARW